MSGNHNLFFQIFKIAHRCIAFARDRSCRSKISASQLYHYHAITQAKASFYIHMLKSAGSAVLSYKYKRGGSIKAILLSDERKTNVLSIHEFLCLLRGSLQDL